MAPSTVRLIKFRMYCMLFHTFCEVAVGSPTQTRVDSVSVKMGPVAGGDNNYHVRINCLSDNKGRSQALILTRTL